MANFALADELVLVGTRFGVPCVAVSEAEQSEMRERLESKLRRDECRGDLWECLRRPYARTRDRDAWRVLLHLVPLHADEIVLWPNYPVGGAVRATFHESLPDALLECSWTRLLTSGADGAFAVIITDEGVTYFAGASTIARARAHYGEKLMCFED